MTAKQPGISERYGKAAKVFASVTLPVPADGYWVNENLFFFMADRAENTVGRSFATPSILRCDGGRIEELISLSRITRIIYAHSGIAIGLDELSNALFDMPDSDTLVVSVRSHDFFVDPKRNCVVKTRAAFDSPALYSPDGRYACFLREHDLWLMNRETGSERPLTTGGVPHRAYGRQPETGLSAISYRERPSPMGLWSPDSQWFLTHRIDERDVPDLALLQNVPPRGGRPILHRYKYSMPGDSMATATYVAIHIESGRVVEFDEFPALVMPLSPFQMRRAWFGRHNSAWFVRFDRFFKQADLVHLNVEKGTGRVALSERVDVGYLELHPIIAGTPNVRTLLSSDEVIWFSERDGWGHLYLYDSLTGRMVNQITRGKWLVRDIVHVDEKQRKVLFLASGVEPNIDPARRSLCSVNLDGSGFETLIVHDGDIHVPVTEPCGLDQDRPYQQSYANPGVSPGGRFSVVQYSNVARGNRTEIIDIRAKRGSVIASAEPQPGDVPPRQFSAFAADGSTKLFGTMFLPSNFDEQRRYALIDYLYPGPQILHQPQSYRALNSTQARVLAELGFVTIMLDTRRMAIGSRALHQAGYGGTWEEPQVADHAAVVRQLCVQFPFIDENRIAVLGQSAGGAAAARALFDYGDVFKLGVAVCGLYDCNSYSSYWADTYCDEAQMDAVRDRSLAAASSKLTGTLLLISGEMDENVHLGQTMSLANALIRANRDFDLLIVPNEGHGVLLSSGYTQRRVWDFFVRHLLGEAPPKHFELVRRPDESAQLWRAMWRECRR